MDEALARRLAEIEARLREIEAALPRATAPAGATPPPLAAPSTGDRYAETLRQAWDGPPAAAPPAAVQNPPVEAVASAQPFGRAPPAVPSPSSFDDRGWPLDHHGDPIELPFAGTAVPPPLPPRVDGPPLMSAYHNQRLAEKQNLLPITADGVGPASASPRIDLEHLVGLKWTGWVGAIVLVVGAALGVKYAFDQHWYVGLSDAARCGLIAAGGVAMLGLGELIYRRINRYASSGFYAAGVVVLYLAVFAGQAWYGLIGPVQAMGLLAGVAAAGMLVAARADLVSVAAVTVLGAVLCPAFTGVFDARPPGFRVYLLAVQAMAVGLCAWQRSGKWWVLRGLTLGATAFDLAVGAVDANQVGFILPGVIFALTSAAIFQGELIFTTWRRPRNEHGRPVVGVTFSMCVTAVMAFMLLVYQGRQPQWVRGETLSWTALAAVTTGLLIARRSVGLTILGRGFYVQAILLLTLAVPVTLDGPAMLFGWMTLAIGLAALAYTNGDDLAAGGATLVWLLAAGGTVLWATGPATRGVVWLHAFGEPVMAAAVIGAALAVVGHAVAYVLHRFFALPPRAPGERVEPTIGLLLDLAAAGVFAAVLALAQPGAVATTVGVGYGLLLWLASLTPALLHLQPVATVVLVATAFKWMTADVVRPRLTPGWRPTGRPFLNAQTANGALLAASFALTGLVDRRRAVAGGRRIGSDTLWTFVATMMALVVAVGLIGETDSLLAVRRAAGAFSAWPGGSAEDLWRTAILAACLAGWLLLLRRTLYLPDWRTRTVGAARVLAYALAAKFVIIDVIAAASARVPPTPETPFNLQMAVAVILIALVAYVGRRSRERPGDGTAGLIALGLLLVAGSAEIDRYALRQGDSPVWIVRQVGWSVYWGVLAVGSLVVGFALGVTRLRVAALVLLGVTLLKLILVDLSGVGTGWRILSFLGLGALLLLTSVLYGRFKRPTVDPV